MDFYYFNSEDSLALAADLRVGCERNKARPHISGKSESIKRWLFLETKGHL